MLKVGYHFSIQPELQKSINDYIKKYPTGQIFISSPQQLGNKDITKRVPAKKLKEIKDMIKKKKFKLFVHANYLINTSYPIKDNKASLNSLIMELKSGEALGAKGVVFHVGKTKGNFTNTVGVGFMIESIVYVLEKIKKYKIRLLLESSAGVGSELGSTIDEFSQVFCGVMKRIKGTSMENNFGICLDTAHLHSSGIDLQSKSAAKKFVKEFQEKIGWQHVKAIHFNDSQRELGSRVDRHGTIGMGYITLSSDGGLKLIARVAQRFRIPLILERSDKLHSELAGELDLVNSWALPVGKGVDKKQLPSTIN